ncbi:D-mannonate oxidoreductase [Vibrio sp. qd031]|uniref:mannitol dehydrogenase family protein n=1 Tax=Vibrio sp. qd031 TaxID=1603038 RepID=UPI000A10D126|nr:mannitol dehydrogenase family protein [Vibrio sp. qd031]ORT52816.1 D-mannonate oxidoreductase [Vibrio sp. qd031]
MTVLDRDVVNANYDETTTYDRSILSSNIVHIGFGAFHRGHQAVYNDLTNDQSDEPWGICEINMFGSANLIDDLTHQQGLFTVVETSSTNTVSRVVRTVCEQIHTPKTGIQAAIDKMVEPQVKIVSLTITEKGYCVDPQSGSLDVDNSLIAHDLAQPHQPQSAIGLITEALSQRMQNNLAPFSVMSCDNIPENGVLTKNAVLSFAKQRDAELAKWIESNVSFPSTMVDRIVPAMTDDQFDVIERKTGYRDPCGVVTEDFRQWVIEDNFVAGRPDWSIAGAMFVNDVLPYEEMKLRMLNGSHSFLAYNGSLAGYEFIFQCMQDEKLRATTLRLMLDEQARSLSDELKVDLQQYAELLIARFSNSNIKHKTAQIAMDGSQKLPQRALDPLLELQKREVDFACLPTLIAGWMHYTIAQVVNKEAIADPLAETYASICETHTTPQKRAHALLSIDKIFGDHAQTNPQFTQAVMEAFDAIEHHGIAYVVDSLAKI